MGYGEQIGKEKILEMYSVSTTSDISNNLNNGRSREAKKSISFLPDITSGICYGLKITSDYRTRIQKEIENLLKRQAFNIPAGESYAESIFRRRTEQ